MNLNKFIVRGFIVIDYLVIIHGFDSATQLLTNHCFNLVMTLFTLNPFSELFFIIDHLHHLEFEYSPNFHSPEFFKLIGHASSHYLRSFIYSKIDLIHQIYC